VRGLCGSSGRSGSYAADTLVDDPEDADEREDLYFDLSLALDDLLKVLGADPRTT
jgi:hypothetical protein